MNTRFEKGRSGNPAGRPKKPKPAPAPTSDFDILLDRSLTITQGGVERELTVEEALAWKTYEAALAGKRPAQRAILKMIENREAGRAKAAPPPLPEPIKIVIAPVPKNTDRTLVLLGIATRDADPDRSADNQRLRLEPWAVQLALTRRRGGSRLTDKEVAEIRRVTRDGTDLRFPRPRRP